MIKAAQPQARGGTLASSAWSVALNPPSDQRKDRSGFGLGLAIAKQAVEAHGGELREHNLPGKGCVFVVDLPVDPSPPLVK